MPYDYTKKKCAGCGRQIAHTWLGTPRWHLCPHGQVCVYRYRLLGGLGPGNHPKRHRDPRYRACSVCADKWSWHTTG